METKKKKTPTSMKTASAKGTKAAIAVTMTYEEMAALGKKEYDEAMTIRQQFHLVIDEVHAKAYHEKILAAANHGHLGACFELSQRYLTSIYRGLQSNEAEGIRWLRYAADRGHSQALFRLGEAYNYGSYGLPRDTRMAASLYKRSTFPETYAHLAYLYHRGDGVPKDLAEARRLYIMADKVDNTPWNNSAKTLGEMYLNGEGVDMDGRQAVMWFKRAALRGDRESAYTLGEIYNHGLAGVEKDHTEAFRWYLAAGADEYLQAMLQVAHMYEIGEGTERNILEAVSWYRKIVDLINRDGDEIYDCGFDGACYWAMRFSEKKIELLLGGTSDAEHKDENKQ